MPKRKCSVVSPTFGQNLIKFRNLCGFTQQQIADILNLNRTTYTKYETGVSEPSIEILKKIAAIYGVDANAILGDDTFTKSVSDFKMPIYSLTKEEQQLIGTYRMFNPSEKQEIKDKVQEIQEKKRKNFT